MLVAFQSFMFAVLFIVPYFLGCGCQRPCSSRHRYFLLGHFQNNFAPFRTILILACFQILDRLHHRTSNPFSKFIVFFLFLKNVILRLLNLDLRSLLQISDFLPKHGHLPVDACKPRIQVSVQIATIPRLILNSYQLLHKRFVCLLGFQVSFPENI